MAVPVWPRTLPQPTQSGYSYQQKAASARTEMDSSTARVRRRYTRVPTHITLRWVFRDAQLAIFEYFWRKELLDGAAWFDVRALSGVGWKLLRVRPVSDGYQVSMPSPGIAEVSMQVEAIDMPVLSGEAYELMQLYGANQIQWIDEILDRFINVTLPAVEAGSPL
ncbi:hypothetical protein P3W85_29995 [Cupriavidus basilensis]|uniref:Uncharacterized protein n=1 Tax=Cupriavidus basilensis TaxID=68895 RepID=A0ABT6AWZ6_9BURK|nr:hypothetical protein [Cupriavidus basilensis]MDF3837156.1 hypothetical protein [Cupriavidus basilensis]